MTTHQEAFLEFSRAELYSGGPDPQVRLVATATQDLPDVTAAHAAGYFVVPYTCGAASALWGITAWGLEESQLLPWLVANAEGLPTRRERRSVWGHDKVKFYQSLASWSAWVRDRLFVLQHRPYDEVYTDLNRHVRFFGRYAAMKVLEVLWLRGLGPQQTDIRPVGAKFPRRTLGLLFPEQAQTLTSERNDWHTLDVVNHCASAAQEWLGTTWFQTETLLCNYRQSLSGKYPGRSHDRELAHWLRAERHFGVSLQNSLPFFELRHGLFPPEHLGERGQPQWWGARSELEVQYRDRVKELKP